MKRYGLWRALAVRIAQMIVVLFGISTALFFILRLSGDPVSLLTGPDAPESVRTAMRQTLGLDDPLYVQYARFISGAARLDFGDSLRSHQAATQVALSKLPATLELTAATLLFIVVVGIPIGMFAATRRRSLLGTAAMSSALALQAIPSFWLGCLLILLFSVHLNWLPSFGRGSWLHLLMPAATLGSVYAAKTARLVRSGLIETESQDFVRTARAKGLHPRTVLWRHTFRNSVLSVVTVILLDISQLVGGAVVTETIFAWPGIGRQLTQAVLSRDYPVVQASVFLIAFLVVLINFLADLVYRFIDPRIEA